MPKLQIRIHEKDIVAGRPEHAVVLECAGFIDAANVAALERALERSARLKAYATILGFSGVEYINSTGISVVIRAEAACRERGALLILANVRRSVALSMHLLGLTRIVPFHRDLASALAFVARILREGTSPEEALKQARAETTTEEDRAVRIPVRSEAKARPPADSSVLILVPGANRFTNILRRRLAHGNGRFHLLTNPSEALSRYDEIHPDLVVVDDRVDPQGEFVAHMKIDKGRSLTSILKIYGRQARVEKAADFWISENDYLIDPFELMELFHLAETELRRVPRDRDVIQQQVRFQYRSQEPLIERAEALARSLIEQSGLDETGRAALLAAYKEAVDNGVRHGNRRSPDRFIDVNYVLEQRKVTIIVEDEGRGFDYEYYLARTDAREAFELAKRRIIQEGRRGGLGILLMRKCTDRLEYRGPGNIVVLEKKLSP